MHRRSFLDRIVERSLAAEHRTDQVERNMARGRRFGHQGSVTPFSRGHPIRGCCPLQRLASAFVPAVGTKSVQSAAHNTLPLFQAVGGSVIDERGLLSWESIALTYVIKLESRRR